MVNLDNFKFLGFIGGVCSQNSRYAISATLLGILYYKCLLFMVVLWPVGCRWQWTDRDVHWNSSPQDASLRFSAISPPGLQNVPALVVSPRKMLTRLFAHTSSSPSQPSRTINWLKLMKRMLICTKRSSLWGKRTLTLRYWLKIFCKILLVKIKKSMSKSIFNVWLCSNSAMSTFFDVFSSSFYSLYMISKYYFKLLYFFKIYFLNFFYLILTKAEKRMAQPKSTWMTSSWP